MLGWVSKVYRGNTLKKSSENQNKRITNNPAIFIGFQNCGRLLNKPEWNKWVIFTEKGARYANHIVDKSMFHQKLVNGKLLIIHYGIETEIHLLHNYNSEPTTVLKVTSQYSQKERDIQLKQNKIKLTMKH